MITHLSDLFLGKISFIGRKNNVLMDGLSFSRKKIKNLPEFLFLFNRKNYFFFFGKFTLRWVGRWMSKT